MDTQKRYDYAIMYVLHNEQSVIYLPFYTNNLITIYFVISFTLAHLN